MPHEDSHGQNEPHSLYLVTGSIGKGGCNARFLINLFRVTATGDFGVYTGNDTSYYLRSPQRGRMDKRAHQSDSTTPCDYIAAYINAHTATPNTKLIR